MTDTQSYNFKFDQHQLMIIDRALQEMPFKLAFPLIRSINEQIEKQNAQPKPDSQLENA